ncbi:group 10 secretory phospholipase A2 [Bombina bombina]|uniref:group 10 secretory phospholipase A2 n=1 Tax=Bombina bombina TaxID=8345 RepID=UPI00235AFDDF|nr:group 10 secretory phospholipase A2 [Bombina bombina]
MGDVKRHAGTSSSPATQLEDAYIAEAVYLYSNGGDTTCFNGAIVRSHIVKKRGLVELAGAIHCGTGRNAVTYITYGCYCGLGGRGMPKDMADWCCQRHDCCYDEAEAAGCRPKMTPYSWSCKDRTVICDNMTDRCKKMICKCDSEIAKCLRKAPFNKRYVMFPNFLCGKRQPGCDTSDD